MPDSVLKTVDEIVAALGGTAAVARLCNLGQPAVSNWKTRKRIAPEWHDLMTTALGRKGFAAPKKLWGQVETARARRAR